MTKPNEREQELASVIRSNLVEMAGKVKPHKIISDQGIRKAIGTSVDLPVPPPNSIIRPAPTGTKDAENKEAIKEQPMEVN